VGIRLALPVTFWRAKLEQAASRRLGWNSSGSFRILIGLESPVQDFINNIAPARESVLEHTLNVYFSLIPVRC
jgi:hypothetical protein